VSATAGAVGSILIDPNNLTISGAPNNPGTILAGGTVVLAGDNGNGNAPSGDANILDTGVNYIIRGHSARVSAFWGQSDPPGGGDVKSNQFTVGAQFQF